LSVNLTNVINTSNTSLASMLDFYMNGFKDTLKDNITATKETLEEIRREMKNATADMSKVTGQSLNSLKSEMQDTLDKMSKTIEKSLDRIGNDLKQSLKEVRDDNRSQLERVRDNNAAQLEKMRETVDEKLTSTLNSRITSAFEVVQKSIDSVQQGFGEMKELTGKVGNLNKMFANVKTRGGWGEVALESLLDQILSPEQYQRQFRLDRNSQEMVDFVIVMPGQSGDINKGGTLRLGAYPCVIAAGTAMERCYGTRCISERHRHRYEFNNEYRALLQDKGLVFSGVSPDGRLVETVELADRPFYIGVQYHPEFKSRPNHPHPLFREFIGAAVRRDL